MSTSDNLTDVFGYYSTLPTNKLSDAFGGNTQTKYHEAVCHLQLGIGSPCADDNHR